MHSMIPNMFPKNCQPPQNEMHVEAHDITLPKPNRDQNHVVKWLTQIKKVHMTKTKYYFSNSIKK